MVTGAGSGIGAETARRLTMEGARVVVADIAADAAAATTRDIRSAGGTAIDIRADVTSANSVAALFAQSVELFGRIDIVVNNAGFTRDMLITKMPETAWDAVVDVILKGALLCAKAALPSMIARQWGRIVNISSRAHLGNPGQANYSAAKAGLLGLTRALALEEGRFNITVNAVAPGIIDTAAVRALPHYAKIRDAARATTPLQRVGEPADVADAVLFLASERAGYITGEVLHVTGGRY